MSLIGCLLATLSLACAQQGQDYFFNTAGQHPRYLAYQQPSLQHNSQQQLPNFFSSQSNGAFDPFRTSSLQNTQQNEFQPIQPSQFQFPPGRSSSLQHFETFSPRPAPPTQFVHTNQHLPQPFQHFQSAQDSSNSQRVPFDGSLVQSTRFQNLPTIQKPTYQSQLQDAFIGIQNSEDETGRTTQSYVNVQHPQGLVDQLSPVSHNRWKQTQSSINTPPVSTVSDTRRLRRPDQVRHSPREDEDDLALNTFVDQNLENEESFPRTSASSSPIDVFTKYQEKKKEDQNIRKKLVNRIQPVSRQTETPSKVRKTLEFPRGTPAIPKTTGKPIASTEAPFRITTLRSKYNNIRLKPTTYTPPSPSSAFDKLQNNRNGFTSHEDRYKIDQQTNRFAVSTTEKPEENIGGLREYSSEFGRPIAKKKTADNNSPLPKTSWKDFASPSDTKDDHIEESDRFNKNHEKSHKYPEDEGIEYEYSAENSDDLTGLGDAYGEIEDTSVKSVSNDKEHNHPDSNKKTVGKSFKSDKNSSFDVLTMNHDHVLVSDENFRDFVDSALIDSSEQPQTDQPREELSDVSITVKSTVKGDQTNFTTHSPSTDKRDLNSKTIQSSTVMPLAIDNEQVKAPPSADASQSADEDEEHPTESWVIVASVQTSRSVSGARFLPGSVTQQESPKPLVPKSSASNDSTTEINNKVKTISSENTTSANHSTNITDTKIVGTTTVDTEVKSSSTVFTPINSSPVPSTESIIDKLDRVQSELSSGILSGGFRPDGNKLHLEVLPEMTSENFTSSPSSSTTTSTTTTTTTTSTTTTEPTTTSSPVVIRKFNPSARKTTVRPKPSPRPTAKSNVTKKTPVFESIQFDDLTGLLPPGFKVRNTFTPKKGITTTTTTESVAEMQGDEPLKQANNSSRTGSGRSTDSSGLPNKIKTVDISAFLPPAYKPSTESSTSKAKGIESIFSKIKFQDVSALLPPGFKPNKTSEVVDKTKETKSPKINFDVPGSLLPPGYKPKDEDVISKKVEKVDISALLPPGYKLTTEEPKEEAVLDSILNKVKFKDVSSLLPPGFKLNNTSTNTSSTSSDNVETTTPSGPIKVVFPSRPGGGRKAPARSSSNMKSAGGIGPVQPKIQKGWPTRATTDFTGWPTPSTTPISIEKILAAAKAAASTEASSTSSTSSTTTTTTTTTTTPAPTTPGICTQDCDLAATIKLVGGAKWVPELLDHNTEEWQTLANEIHDQLESVYSSSESLSRWYKNIRIDTFSEGSVLVDYVVELTDLGHTVNTGDMRRLFHEALQQATVDHEALSGGDTLSAHNTSEFKMGKFVVDPKFTDFVVLPKQVVPTVGLAEEDVLLPQWAIAVIVIGLASLLFVIIFGVTVLVNRHNSAKKKQPVALTEDMLNELNKNHMGGLDNYGADDLYNMEDVWNEKPTKKRSSGSLQENSMANLYDSWRSEWNGYYYNAYYGGNNGGGSSTSGYARRRSDYDTNF